MSVEIRGGVPRTLNLSAAAAPGATVNLPFGTKFLQIYNLGANPVRIYWTEKDLNDDANFITLTANAGTRDFWEGPAEVQSQSGCEPDDVRGEANNWGNRFFVEGQGGASNIEVTAFAKLG